MKENRKKIIVRAGAMVSALLLCALCALPIFADENETIDYIYDWNSKDVLLDVYNLTDIDPLYYVVQNTTNLQLQSRLYQFSVVPENKVLTNRSYVSFAERGTGLIAAYTVIRDRVTGTVYDFGYGYWNTSHTTTGTNKFVYFDFYDGESSWIRMFRIRIKIDTNTDTILDSSIETDFVEYYPIISANGLASNWDIGVSVPQTQNVVFAYGLGEGFLLLRKNLEIFYPQYQNTVQIGAAQGYEDGCLYGKQIGFNEGYNDGMSQTSLLNGVTAIFRAPMEFINSVLNFEIFDINMAVAVRVLISLAVLGVVVTFIWKAVK